MASEEPSTNHLVISPLWITRALDGDSGNRISSVPFDIVETLTLFNRPTIGKEVRLVFGMIETGLTRVRRRRLGAWFVKAGRVWRRFRGSEKERGLGNLGNRSLESETERIFICLSHERERESE